MMSEVVSSINFVGLIWNEDKFNKIPLGILPKCEIKHKDMISILDHLHQYIPTMSVEDTVEIPVPLTIFTTFFLKGTS